MNFKNLYLFILLSFVVFMLTGIYLQSRTSAVAFTTYGSVKSVELPLSGRSGRAVQGKKVRSIICRGITR